MEKLCQIEYCPNPQAVTIHTGFNIQNNEPLKIIIEHVDGVEDVLWGTHKYSFLVIVGKMFDRKLISNIIEQKIKEFVSY